MRELAKNFTSAYIPGLASHPEPRIAMPERHGKQREHGGFSADSADMLGVGLQFAGAILLFLFIGRWLDERLDTGPWLLLAGVFIGAAAGFYAMYRRLVILPRARRKQTGEDGR